MATSYLEVGIRSAAERDADEKAAGDTLGQIEQAERELIELVGQWAARWEAKLHVDRSSLWLIDDICADVFHGQRQEALDEAGLDSDATWKRSDAIAELAGTKGALRILEPITETPRPLTAPEFAGAESWQPMSQDEFRRIIVEPANVTAAKHRQPPLSPAVVANLYARYIEGRGSLFSPGPGE